MLSKEKVENATKAYVHLYNMVMDIVKNLDFAAQIAMSVIMVVEIIKKNKDVWKNIANTLIRLSEKMQKV